MKVKIVGIEDRTYTDKSTGEVKESVAVHFERAPKDPKNAFGVVTGFEVITARAFPTQFNMIKREGEKILGKSAVISKDVRTFRDSSFSVIDEFEILA